MLTMKDIIDDSNKKIREVSKEVPLPVSYTHLVKLLG